MSIEEKIRELHQKAWSKRDEFTSSLEEAIALCEVAYENGENTPLFINNYAVALLDLHRDQEALDLLKNYEPSFSEYCSNYAIAVAKAKYDLKLIRKWNKAASKQPKQEGAIVAYMDWQGL